MIFTIELDSSISIRVIIVEIKQCYIAIIIIYYNFLSILSCNLLGIVGNRTNLTASGPRPNPQGSYHYGLVNISRTIQLASSAAQVNGKQRYALNSVSFIPADTPLKLADYFKIGGVFRVGSIPDSPSGQKMHLDTSVMGADFRSFVEIVFENHEVIVQSLHLDGYSFWVVG